MSLIQKTITIDDESRDKGKTFVITEMPCRPADRWALRALFATLNSGINIPLETLNSGWAGLAMLGWLKAATRIPFEIAEPLLDELLECVQRMPNKNSPNILRRLIDDDTEEVSTLFKLRKEVFNLHTENFMRGVKSTSGLTPEPVAPT